MSGLLRFGPNAYNAQLPASAAGEEHVLPLAANGVDVAHTVYISTSKGTGSGKGAWGMPAIDIAGTATTPNGNTAATANQQTLAVFRERQGHIVDVSGYDRWLSFGDNGLEYLCIAPCEFLQPDYPDAITFAGHAVNTALSASSQAIAIPNDASGNRARAVFMSLSVSLADSANDDGVAWFLPATDEPGTPTTLAGATAVTGGAGGTGVMIRSRVSFAIDVRGYSHILAIGSAIGELLCIAPLEV